MGFAPSVGKSASTALARAIRPKIGPNRSVYRCALPIPAPVVAALRIMWNGTPGAGHPPRFGASRLVGWAGQLPQPPPGRGDRACPPWLPQGGGQRAKRAKQERDWTAHGYREVWRLAARVGPCPLGDGALRATRLDALLEAKATVGPENIAVGVFVRR